MGIASFEELQVTTLMISELYYCKDHIYRQLNQLYPHLATENEFMRCLVAVREVYNLDDTYFFALYHFTLEFERLQIGGTLLPDLLEFYQWIHIHLSHLVTYEKAKEITIGSIIKLSASRYSQELCEHLTKLFERIVGRYFCDWIR